MNEDNEPILEFLTDEDFRAVGESIVEYYQRTPERTLALRALVEAQDWASLTVLSKTTPLASRKGDWTSKIEHVDACGVPMISGLWRQLEKRGWCVEPHNVARQLCACAFHVRRLSYHV